MAKTTVQTPVPPDIRAIIERMDEMFLACEELLRDAETTGRVDRILLRDCLAAYGRSRRELLIALGEDPECEDLLPFPAELHES